MTSQDASPITYLITPMPAFIAAPPYCPLIILMPSSEKRAGFVKNSATGPSGSVPNCWSVSQAFGNISFTHLLVRATIVGACLMRFMACPTTKDPPKPITRPSGSRTESSISASDSVGFRHFDRIHS